MKKNLAIALYVDKNNYIPLGAFLISLKRFFNKYDYIYIMIHYQIMKKQI